MSRTLSSGWSFATCRICWIAKMEGGGLGVTENLRRDVWDGMIGADMRYRYFDRLAARAETTDGTLHVPAVHRFRHDGCRRARLFTFGGLVARGGERPDPGRTPRSSERRRRAPSRLPMRSSSEAARAELRTSCDCGMVLLGEDQAVQPIDMLVEGLGQRTHSRPAGVPAETASTVAWGSLPASGTGER